MAESPTRALLATGICALLCAPSVWGHGSLIYPVSRNARDAEILAQSGQFPCNFPAKLEDAGVRNPGGGGQPCLWFSQGCTIGCDTCDNHTQHTNGKSLCNSTMQPTLPKEAWTMNLWAEPASVNDSYRFNPWRAPGAAPVVDACGMAGGRHSSDPGGGDAVFTTVPWAKLGDLGTEVLTKGNATATWKAGDIVEVIWGIRFNHGGGYSYRLCPASEPLSEACFQKYPLKFSGDPVLKWNNGTELPLKGVFVETGTTPPGSMWQRNPIPRIDFDSKSSGQPPNWSGCDMPAIGTACRQFDPPCVEQVWNGREWHGSGGANDTRNVDVQGDCSGDLTLASIVDRVVIPPDFPPGDAVLGWRWDCEETAQIWSSCADVAITA